MPLISVLVFLVSCSDENSKNHIVDQFDKNSESGIVSLVSYAKGFDIQVAGDITKLVIYNPQNLKNVMSTYYFTASSNKLEDATNVFTEQLNDVAVFSATQLNGFSKLNLIDRVIAISESEYIQNPVIKERHNKGDIVELAGNGNFYLEKTLEINPSVIFYSPYNMSQKHPLAATEITMIPYFDFMESNPLGRAEWIKFTGLFFGKEQEAIDIFDSIVFQYNSYNKLTQLVVNKPTVFSDKYFSGQWYVSGGQSYIAQLFNDAGADYLWKENQNTASINLDFEVVYNKAHDADFWRIVGTYPEGFTYDKLGAENNLYVNFKAFKDKGVIFCDSKASSYFETGTLEPHILLADLIFAFHPDLLDGYKPKYYHLCK